MKFLSFILFAAPFLVGFYLYPMQGNSQNIGIGVPNPGEKLQVHGTIFSDSSGFRFPDGSLQSRAYNAYESEDAGDNRWIIIMDCVNPSIPGSFSFDSLVNKIKVVEYSWGMLGPIAGGASQPTINNITIIKNIDASTNPLLESALVGQHLVSIELNFFRPLQGGGMQKYYKIILQDVVVTRFDQIMVYKGGEDYVHMDYMELSFFQATWIYNGGDLYYEVEYSPISK